MGIVALWFVGLFYGFLTRLAPSEGWLAAKDVLLLALVVRTATSAQGRRVLAKLPWLPFVALALVAMASAVVNETPALTTIMGFRATFEWATLAWISAAWITAPMLRLLLVRLSPVIVAIALFAAWQAHVGESRLLSSGFQYAANVREAAGLVRSFGTITYGAPFAHTMAIIAMASLAIALYERDLGTRWACIVAASAAGAGIVLALNRTALAGAILGCGILLLAGSRCRLPSLGPIIVALCVILGVMSMRGGAFLLPTQDDSVRSLDARFATWRTLVTEVQPVLGDGPGSYGVAAVLGTAGHPSNPVVVTDNYYLATTLQYGVLGSVTLLWILMSVWRRLTLRRSESDWIVAAARASIAFLAIAMSVTNMWEDFPTPIFLWTVIGTGLASVDREAQLDSV